MLALTTVPSVFKVPLLQKTALGVHDFGEDDVCMSASRARCGRNMKEEVGYSEHVAASMLLAACSFLGALSSRRHMH